VLEAHKQLIDESNALWNFFTVIALGVVGIIYGGVKLGSVGRARLPVSLGFGVWALANMSSLTRVQALLVTLTASMNSAVTLKDTPEILKPLLKQIWVAPTWSIVLFHVVLDIIVLGAIWWPTLGKARGARRRETPPTAVVDSTGGVRSQDG
jgi:hypothetical protein